MKNLRTRTAAAFAIGAVAFAGVACEGDLDEEIGDEVEQEVEEGVDEEGGDE